jgi:hypothetical protein
MTRVRFNDYGRERVMDLSTALTPGDDLYDGGALEQANATANSTARAVGELLAHLVVTGAMDLNKAAKIAGVYYDLEIVP